MSQRYASRCARLLTEYTYIFKHLLRTFQAYAPGKYFTVPPLPNVTAVDVLGDFDIAADRLAIIDGEGR